jgi:hypothetical protein
MEGNERKMGGKKIHKPSGEIGAKTRIYQFHLGARWIYGPIEKSDKMSSKCRDFLFFSFVRRMSGFWKSLRFVQEMVFTAENFYVALGAKLLLPKAGLLIFPMSRFF